MGSSIYLTLTGKKQGMISSGCGTVSSIGNRHQLGHEDEIFVHEVGYGIQMHDNISLAPLTIVKEVDKASPLLFQAVNDNEMVDCVFNFYRTSVSGMMENYYKIKLINARIVDISVNHPHTLNSSDSSPQEMVTFEYKSITMDHITANTSGWAAWNS